MENASDRIGQRKNRRVLNETWTKLTSFEQTAPLAELRPKRMVGTPKYAIKFGMVEITSRRNSKKIISSMRSFLVGSSPQ